MINKGNVILFLTHLKKGFSWSFSLCNFNPLRTEPGILIKSYKTLIYVAIIIFFQIPSMSQKENEILLKDVIKNISSYKNKELTLELRLKNYNKVFDKLVFYDRKNIDVIFDISSRAKKRKLRKNMMNLHEGLRYSVKFVVTDVDSLGRLFGNLLEFKAVFMNFEP